MGSEMCIRDRIKKICALADETYEERARLRAYFAEECRIWGQIAEQIEGAEWHISGQMKELAEQISEAQSSQPADQHSLQHQQHKREKSANYWRHNTPTTGAAAERLNKRKHAQMKHPERRTLNNKKKKVRQTFNNLWIIMLQTISEKVGLPQEPILQ